MRKQIVAHPYHGDQKECRVEARNSTDESQNSYAGRKKPDRKEDKLYASIYRKLQKMQAN